jgi:uncharacterized protein GlcG (DUF336 family)
MALRHVASTLTLEQATTIATRAIAAGRRERMLPVPGGVLILDGDGRAFGAVGISGDTSDRDEYCAIEGIKSAGLGCDPPEPAPGGSPAGSTSQEETHARRGHAK